MEGNAKLEISRSGAQLAGPGLGGVLVQWIGAASAITADAVSFVVSALFLRGIRAQEPPVDVTVDEGASRLRGSVARFGKASATCCVIGCCA